MASKLHSFDIQLGSETAKVVRVEDARTLLDELLKTKRRFKMLKKKIRSEKENGISGEPLDFEPFTLVLPKTMVELGVMEFDTPITVEVYPWGGKIGITWDCGMDGIPFYPETAWCDIAQIQDISEKVRRVCRYDLAHAFFHFEGDPNYTHYHWALRSLYKDNVTLDEDSLCCET
jgi:hypothetical protein